MNESRDEIVQRIRGQGFMVRLTEWLDGWQAGAFHRRHPARFCAVTPWVGSEMEAWQALDAALEPVRAAVSAETSAVAAAPALAPDLR